MSLDSRAIAPLQFILHLIHRDYYFSGGPAAPVLQLRMISPTLLLLEWNTPFTWPNTAINHYSLSVNNSMEDWNQTILTDTSVEIRNSGMLAACTVYTFSVLANNGIANGKLGSITGGFPVIGMCL